MCHKSRGADVLAPLFFLCTQNVLNNVNGGGESQILLLTLHCIMR